MKKYLSGFIAIVMGVTLALGASAFKNGKKHHDRKKLVTEYYFEFTGIHGNEGNTALWTEISATDYENLGCAGHSKGCRIITSSVTGTVPNRHPSSVPVDANKKPTITSPTLDANYQD